MLESISNYFVNKWLKSKVIPYNLKNVYKYGIEIFFSTIIGILNIITLGFLFGSINKSLLFLCVFIPIRLYSGGYHASNYLNCNIIISIIFIIINILSDLIELHLFGIILMWIFSIITVLLLCPVESINKPIKKEQRKALKIKALLSVLLFNTLLTLSYVYDNIMFCETIFFTLFAILLLIPIGIIKNYKERKQ